MLFIIMNRLFKFARRPFISYFIKKKNETVMFLERFHEIKFYIRFCTLRS